MWAEWMKDYDLRLTKEEIEEYENRKRGTTIMNLFINRTIGFTFLPTLVYEHDFDVLYIQFLRWQFCVSW